MHQRTFDILRPRSILPRMHRMLLVFVTPLTPRDEKRLRPLRRARLGTEIQGYLAHKEQPLPSGPI